MYRYEYMVEAVEPFILAWGPQCGSGKKLKSTKPSVKLPKFESCKCNPECGGKEYRAFEFRRFSVNFLHTDCLITAPFILTLSPMYQPSFPFSCPTICYQGFEVSSILGHFLSLISHIFFTIILSKCNFINEFHVQFSLISAVTVVQGSRRVRTFIEEFLQFNFELLVQIIRRKWQIYQLVLVQSLRKM